MFLMMVDGMLSAPDQTGLLNRSLEACQYTKRQRRTTDDSEEALCAAHEGYGTRAGGVSEDRHGPASRDDIVDVDKNGLVEGTK